MYSIRILFIDFYMVAVASAAHKINHTLTLNVIVAYCNLVKFGRRLRGTYYRNH